MEIKSSGGQGAKCIKAMLCRLRGFMYIAGLIDSKSPN